MKRVFKLLLSSLSFLELYFGGGWGCLYWTWLLKWIWELEIVWLFKLIPISSILIGNPLHKIIQNQFSTNMHHNNQIQFTWLKGLSFQSHDVMLEKGNLFHSPAALHNRVFCIASLQEQQCHHLFVVWWNDCVCYEHKQFWNATQPGSKSFKVVQGEHTFTLLHSQSSFLLSFLLFSRNSSASFFQVEHFQNQNSFIYPRGGIIFV